MELPENWEYTEKETSETKIGFSPIEAYDFFFFYPSYEKEEFDQKWQEGGSSSVSAIKLLTIEGDTVDQIASQFSSESECQVESKTFGDIEGKDVLCYYNPDYPKQSYILGNDKGVFVFQASGEEKRSALDSIMETFEFTS